MWESHESGFLSRNCSTSSRVVNHFGSADADGMDEVNAWIESVNDGNRVVPTVLYSDGTFATNPEASAVRAKLRELNGEE